MNDGSLRYYMELVTIARQLSGQITLEQIIGLLEHNTTET
jgi:hypothetical protein